MGIITGLCVKETMTDVVVENEIAVFDAATQTVPDIKCSVGTQVKYPDPLYK